MENWILPGTSRDRLKITSQDPPNSFATRGYAAGRGERGARRSQKKDTRVSRSIISPFKSFGQIRDPRMKRLKRGGEIRPYKFARNSRSENEVARFTPALHYKHCATTPRSVLFGKIEESSSFPAPTLMRLAR